MDANAVKIVIATGNSHKVEEFRALFTDFDVVAGPDASQSVVSMRDLGHELSVTESGITFADNALLKARAGFAATGMPTMADDSGIIVDVFGSAPGVWSARWAADAAGDKANMQLLLAQTKDLPAQHRTARFVCALALVTSHTERVWEGEVVGSLATEALGDSGFGYDPIFIPQGYKESFAQLGADVKNKLSHRTAAVRRAAPELAALI